MLKAEFILTLPYGGYITYEEAFSPFTIYTFKKRQGRYLLIPKQGQKKLQGIVIVATEVGIRICQQKGWPKMFVSNVRQIIDCRNQNEVIKINYLDIPTDVQGVIIDKLVNTIQYKSV